MDIKFGQQVHPEELSNQAGAGNVFTSRSSQESISQPTNYISTIRVPLAT